MFRLYLIHLLFFSLFHVEALGVIGFPGTPPSQLPLSAPRQHTVRLFRVFQLLNILSLTQVTWDEYSLLIHGKRVMIFSGEVHPYRFVSILACQTLFIPTPPASPSQVYTSMCSKRSGIDHLFYTSNCHR